MRTPGAHHTFVTLFLICATLFRLSRRTGSTTSTPPPVELPTWVGAQGYFKVLDHFLLSS